MTESEQAQATTPQQFHEAMQYVWSALPNKQACQIKDFVDSQAQKISEQAAEIERLKDRLRFEMQPEATGENRMTLPDYREHLKDLTPELQAVIGYLVEASWLQGNEQARRIVYSSSYKDFARELKGETKQ